MGGSQTMGMQRRPCAVLRTGWCAPREERCATSCGKSRHEMVLQPGADGEVGPAVVGIDGIDWAPCAARDDAAAALDQLIEAARFDPQRRTKTRFFIAHPFRRGGADWQITQCVFQIGEERKNVTLEGTAMAQAIGKLQSGSKLQPGLDDDVETFDCGRLAAIAA